MNKTYIPAVISLGLLSILNYFASLHHWYVRYHGLDILMHILGGIGLAFAINWIITTIAPRYSPTFWYIILLTFLAGVAWEAMEAVNDIAGAPVGTAAYYLDTAKDIVNDTLGAIIAAFFLRKIK